MEVRLEATAEQERVRQQGQEHRQHQHQELGPLGGESAGLKVHREPQQTFEVVLTAEPDRGWPVADRGLVFASDTRIEKADSISAALMIGLRREKKLFPILDFYSASAYHFLGLPTTFRLPREAVDKLKAIGAKILDESDEFQRLVEGLKK